MTDADSENHEVEHWLLTAHRDGYIAEEQTSQLLAEKREVGRLLGGMIREPASFLLDDTP